MDPFMYSQPNNATNIPHTPNQILYNIYQGAILKCSQVKKSAGMQSDNRLRTSMLLF